MTILHLSSEKTWRGGEQQIAYLLEESQKHGITCLVACRKNSAFETYCQQHGIPYAPLPFANEFDVVTAKRIKDICKNYHVDLLHAHSAHSHALSVWSSLLGNPTPIVLSRRVDFPVRNNVLSHFKYNYPGVKKIICVSDKIKEVMQAGIKHPERCVTVHSGIDLSRFASSRNTGILHREFNIPEGIPLIGNISAIAPHKDYFTFVNTADLLKKQGLQAKYFIIGDGPMLEQIQAYVLEKNLQDDVIFTGFRSDIPAILPELNVFLITSETEGLGTTILDAFACRVPVVATNGGGIPETVKHERTGLLANVKDATRLASYVQRMLADSDLRQQLTQQAYELLQEFRKEATALKTIAVYQSIEK